MNTTSEEKMYRRGLLKIGDVFKVSKDDYSLMIPVFEKGLLIRERNENDREYVNRITSDVRKECIEHSKFKSKATTQADLNLSLIDCIWDYVKQWCSEKLKMTVNIPCHISIGNSQEMGNAYGLFYYSNPSYGKCEIKISKDILGDTGYFLIVLIHEYMHYIHYRIVDHNDYISCPSILSEGFSEYGARIFYSQNKYNIESHLLKSWNEYYEIGRQLVHQICEEGFGIEGFVKGFLNNIPPKSPWKSLDHWFPRG